MNMNEYDDDLRRLELADSTEIVSNSSTDHARALIARLIGSAKERVVVFSGSLNPKIYCDTAVVDAIGAFLLGRNGHLEIVVQRDSTCVPDRQIVSDVGCLVDRLRAAYGESVLARVTIARASPIDSVHHKVHFMVVDSKGFRLEPDNTAHRAFASFNQPQFASQLYTAFLSIIKRSSPIALS